MEKISEPRRIGNIFTSSWVGRVQHGTIASAGPQRRTSPAPPRRGCSARDRSSPAKTPCAPAPPAGDRATPYQHPRHLSAPFGMRRHSNGRTTPPPFPAFPAFRRHRRIAFTILAITPTHTRTRTCARSGIWVCMLLCSSTKRETRLSICTSTMRSRTIPAPPLSRVRC